MQILLLGERNSERTIFFINAANELGITVKFVELPSSDAFQGFDYRVLRNCAVKIDPPDPHSVCIGMLNAFGLNYSLFLEKMQNISRLKFLNAPEMIAHTLDKLRCKRTLEEAGVSTPPSIKGVNSVSELRTAMSEKRLGGVFIKPRFGSGAAGIAAYRRNPKTSEEVIYTSVQMSDGRACNTKKIRRIHDQREIEAIITDILHSGAIVERWIPKAYICGKTYDLRIVWQFGKIESMVARLSTGSITNLHLGGDVLSLDELPLSNEKQYEIEKLCFKAMSLFPGLNSAGIDILLEQHSLKPYIIEINGQGDLLYKDVLCGNRIYKNQLFYLDGAVERGTQWTKTIKKG